MTIFLTDNDCHLIMRALNHYLSTLDWQNEPVDDPNHVELFLTYFQQQYDIYARTENGIAEWFVKPVNDCPEDADKVYYICSNCGKSNVVPEKYCSQCGCKMTNVDFKKGHELDICKQLDEQFNENMRKWSEGTNYD